MAVVFEGSAGWGFGRTAAKGCSSNVCGFEANLVLSLGDDDADDEEDDDDPALLSALVPGL